MMTDKDQEAVEIFEPISNSVSQRDQEPVKSKKLFRFLIGSDIPPIPDVPAKYPESNVSFFSRLTYSWISPILRVSIITTLNNLPS
jgi:hypothetical protein